MTRPLSVAALLYTAALVACDKNAVQELPVAPQPGASVKFFNFGVNAPQVNFYANETKMTAVLSATGQELTTGVAYGSAGNGGLYSAIVPGIYTLTGRIAAATDKDLPIDTVSAALADGKSYSFYLSGFYDTVNKKVDGFVAEDPLPATIAYSVAYVRLVHAISNANPLTLYARLTGDTVTAHWAAIGGAVSYKGAGAFMTIVPGVYDLGTRYTDSTTNKITRTGVSLVGGRVYTVGARGDITVVSTTATNRPFLDNTANR